jgi:hypothetical protein
VSKTRPHCTLSITDKSSKHRKKITKVSTTKPRDPLFLTSAHGSHANAPTTMASLQNSPTRTLFLNSFPKVLTLSLSIYSYLILLYCFLTCSWLSSRSTVRYLAVKEPAFRYWSEPSKWERPQEGLLLKVNFFFLFFGLI